MEPRPDFSVGQLHGWPGVFFGLLASALFLVSGWQDLKPKSYISAGFWFFLALLLCLGVVWLGVVGRVWGASLLGAAALCLEAWLIQRWWRAGENPG